MTREQAEQAMRDARHVYDHTSAQTLADLRRDWRAYLEACSAIRAACPDCPPRRVMVEGA